mmetsp:Transcript_6855/g.14864  ORF Transcript_6855/g.14864 Transcript_6855/m.14864 type:complete len:164 (-) Transcript_6855:301-792(-)
MAVGNNSLGTFAITTALVATAVCSLLLIPRVRAFLTPPATARRSIHKRTLVTHHRLSPIQEHCNDDDNDDDDDDERQPDGMPRMPSNAVKYTQVPKPSTTFKASTIPSGLLKQHTTKKGTWGIIRVSSGQLEYTIIEPRKSVHVLDKDHLGVIEPKMLHQVEQ